MQTALSMPCTIEQGVLVLGREETRPGHSYQQSPLVLIIGPATSYCSYVDTAILTVLQQVKSITLLQHHHTFDIQVFSISSHDGVTS